MLVTKKELEEKGVLSFSSNEEIKASDFDKLDGFISLKNCHVEASLRYGEGLDIALTHLFAEGTLVLKSTRTNNPVEYKFKETDDITFTFSDDEDLKDDDDIIKLSEDYVDLHDYLVSLIVSSIPLKVVGEDEPESLKGDSWEVLSEEEYSKRKKDEIDPRFAALADLDFDD